MDRLFTQAKEQFGSIDIAVANTGLELLGTQVADLTDEQIDRMVNVNARGTLLTLQRDAREWAACRRETRRPPESRRRSRHARGTWRRCERMVLPRDRLRT
jgi:NAD(P)-dependent dehydrogenase (short-subunit alcohol dehydrogenase family)